MNRSIRHDPSLDLPARPRTPDRVPPIEALGTPRVPEGPFTLSGRRLQVVFDANEGIETIRADGALVTGPWRWSGLRPRAEIRSPRRLRRELEGEGGVLAESIVVPDRLPGLLVQVERVEGPAEASPCRLEVVLLPDSGEFRARCEPGIAHLESAAGHTTLWILGPDPLPTPAIDDDGRLAVEFAPDLGTPITLVLLNDPAEGPGVSATALAALPAHARRAEIDARGEGQGGMELELGVPAVDEGFAWMRAVLRDRLRSAGPDRPGVLHAPAEEAPAPADLLAIVRGGLAAGDREVARAALLAMPSGPEALLAWSRWIAWTGEARFLLDHRERIEASLPSIDALPAFTGERLRKTVADAVEAAGEEEWAGELRAAPGAADEDAESPIAGDAVEEEGAPDGPPPAEADATNAGGAPARDRAEEEAPAKKKFVLPMAGASAPPARTEPDPEPVPAPAPERPHRAPPPIDDLLSAARWALPVPEEHGEAADRFVPANLDDALAAWVIDRGDAGYPLLESELARWAEGRGSDEVRAATALAAIAEGMLGIRPDAAFGRIRIAPQFPDGWTRLSFTGITVEKMRVQLHYTRSGSTHIFVALPEEGGVPGMLIFEPRVPGSRIREVRVDGAVAEVASAPVGDRVHLQVQLPIDRERRVEIDVEE